MPDPTEKKSAFVEILGSEGTAKIVEAFLDHATTTLTAADVAKIADVSKSTFHRNREALCELGVIRTAGEVSGTTVYELDRGSEVAAALAEAKHHLRQQISDQTPEDDETAASVGETQRRVGELVPTLFGEESDRVSAAEELCELARTTPSAFVDMVPALVELLDDETDSDVRVRVAAILERVRREFPDRFDFDRTDLVDAVPMVVGSRAMTTNEEWPFDEDDRLSYGTRTSSPL